MTSKRSIEKIDNGRTRAPAPDRVSVDYIRENFEPNDRLAVVLLDKRTRDVLQRIAGAEKIAAEDFQAWLRYKNANGYEVYLSMNALAKDATGRTKVDVETIRHLYLDFDYKGTVAVENLLARSDLPKPNYLINTSPDKWQVVWKVQGFGKDQAEGLQRELSREMGADPAATDCSRVLRLPGFYNHKYSRPVWVGVQVNTRETYGPERFPEFSVDATAARNPSESIRARNDGPASGGISQSERDWAYAKRALARGEPEALVVAAIANHRRYDKHNPQHYAELTVHKATESIESERWRADSLPGSPDR
jgi:hypothetical protein